jgi:PKD repeat protein
VPAQAPLVRLVMISPGLTFPEGTWRYAVGDAHYQWTSNAIDGARSAHIPWVVVGMHAPCISVGQHPCDSGADITNLLLSKKVDLVLAGHEHYYTRTKQLHLGTGCSGLVPGTYDPDCVGDADDDVQKDAGTVVITAGTGGTPIREVNTADSEMPYLAAWSGSNVSPSYGFLDVTADADSLEARFVPATGSFTDAVTIRAAGGPGGQPPTAAVAEPQCAALACGFDGGGSSDPDGGSLTAYAWDFGDGATGTGTTPSHTYGAAGTYFVSLTVTDDEGTTGTASRLVTVNDGSPQPLASDGFGRTVAKGWGGADIGGQWSVSANARTSVQAGMGRLLMPKTRAATSARLDEVSSTSSDLRVALTVDKTLVGGGVNATVIGRSTPAGGQYRSTVRLKPGGAVQVSLDRFDAGTLTTVVAPVTLSGVTLTPGTLLHVRMQTTGVGPTTLRVKAWLDGQAEPSSWRSTATDGTAGRQDAGGVGVMATLTPAATNAPVTLLVDDLQVTPVGP